VALESGTLAVSRDVAAFRAFYDSALPEVYGYLLHRCGGERAVAEDLTQETFLAAVRVINDGDGGVVSIPWLIGVARHKLIDHFRRLGREDRKVLLLQDAMAVDDDAIRWRVEASRDQAHAALLGLPPAQRAAMVLRYLDDLPVPEVAQLLGRSVHATESLLARGRDGFKRRYLESDDA
jgi:RNA polymerase sigma-70 factor (ECF subfamily)